MVKLKEYIYKEMDILFLALNAPETSNANAHWFSRNLSFWNLLSNSGLITQNVNDSLKGDEIVFGSNSINHNNWIFGVTDLNNEIVETDSNFVNIEDYHLVRIIQILDQHQVKKICLMHSKVGEIFRQSKYIEKPTNARYGLVGFYKNTEIYEVPFHNASVANKEQYYKLLIENNTLKTTNSVVKKNAITQQSSSTVQANFILPAQGNSITQNDIKKSTLRITADFKDYFPSKDSIIKILIDNETYNSDYKINEGRSSLLKIGKDAVNQLKLKPNNHLKFEKLGLETFRISKT